MEFFQVIAKRRSVRRFLAEPVPRAHLQQMIEAARLAPSGCNRQMWRFIALDNAEDIQWFAAYDRMAWVAKAPALVLFSLDPANEYWREDGSAAVENFMLAAAALDHGTCWVQGQMLPYEEKVKERFHVPKSWRVLAVVPVGRTEKWPEMPKKKSLEDVLSFGRF